MYGEVCGPLHVIRTTQKDRIVPQHYEAVFIATSLDKDVKIIIMGMYRYILKQKRMITTYRISII